MCTTCPGSDQKEASEGEEEDVVVLSGTPGRTDRGKINEEAVGLISQAAALRQSLPNTDVKM